MGKEIRMKKRKYENKLINAKAQYFFLGCNDIHRCLRADA
jgi:hypothetical protein